MMVFVCWTLVVGLGCCWPLGVGWCWPLGCWMLVVCCWLMFAVGGSLLVALRFLLVVAPWS